MLNSTSRIARSSRFALITGTVILAVTGCVSSTSRSFEILSSTAMAPTIMPGDRLLTDTAAYSSIAPHDGDIVVFSPPLPELGTAPFVKRIVATPGETLAIHRGHLYVDGKVVAEPYVQTPADYELKIRNRALYVDGLPLDPSRTVAPAPQSWSAPDEVPPGYYVVLGDNRNDSDDSHLWGFLARGRIIAKVESIYWPISRYRHF